MAERPLFSERNELRKPSDGLVREDIPPKIRIYVCSTIQELKWEMKNDLWEKISSGIDLENIELTIDNLTPFDADDYDILQAQHEITDHLTTYIKDCPFTDFLDICEIIHDYLHSGFNTLEFKDGLNRRFERYYSVYQMNDDGEIVEYGSRASEQAISEALVLLTAPALNGPDRQFRYAVLAFQRNPPNYEVAVANAASAVEGVARCVLGDDSVMLGTALSRIQQEKDLPGALVQSMKVVWGHASDAGGRHGQVGDSQVDRPIAEFCLHHAAASIVLIARRYGIEVVEGG